MHLKESRSPFRPSYPIPFHGNASDMKTIASQNISTENKNSHVLREGKSSALVLFACHRSYYEDKFLPKYVSKYVVFMETRRLGRVDKATRLEPCNL